MPDYQVQEPLEGIPGYLAFDLLMRQKENIYRKNLGSGSVISKLYFHPAVEHCSGRAFQKQAAVFAGDFEFTAVHTQEARAVGEAEGHGGCGCGAGPGAAGERDAASPLSDAHPYAAVGPHGGEFHIPSSFEMTLCQRAHPPNVHRVCIGAEHHEMRISHIHEHPSQQ